MVQAIAAGRFGSLAEARRYLAANLTANREFETFAPQPSSYWEKAAIRFGAIEERFRV
jgi:hypothetical protein